MSRITGAIAMSSSRTMCLVLTLVAYSLVLHAVEGGQQQLPKPNWDFKYQSGSLGLKSGMWVKVAFATVEHQQYGSRVLVTVPIKQMSAVQFSRKAEKDSELLQGMQRSGCAYARSMMPTAAAQAQPEALIVMATSPGAVSRLAEKLNRRHSVRLIWKDSHGEQYLKLGVNDCEYASFLANLRLSLGPRWQTVESGSQ